MYHVVVHISRAASGRDLSRLDLILATIAATQLRSVRRAAFRVSLTALLSRGFCVT